LAQQLARQRRRALDDARPVPRSCPGHGTGVFRLSHHRRFIDGALYASRHARHKLDPDEPLPELITNGHQSSLAKWIGKTPREVALSQSSKMGIDFTGTIDHVASMMQDIMEEVGGDGFLLFNGTFDRRYIVEVCDGLVPELQRRGLTRTGYSHKCFKDNLLEF
jgi:alkanesulfonate monooxygenase SsuD/methylene tetrahydromethanopterin reductase-like flavin-dependent oxidoreductase (luciferase family)